MQKELTSWPLKSDYQKLSGHLYSQINPTPVENPEMLVWNEALALKLGLSNLSDTIEVLAGNKIPENVHPIAQAYAGHQFGHFNILGDGRAILLGEVESNEQLFDVQLKGSGPTPYSRRGDGRATLYSMLREYLISEAMHALNVPTSRSLSVIKSTTLVYREQVQDSGILTRVMSSHIRVGTFAFVAYQQNPVLLKEFFTYAAKRHYPEVLAMEVPALEFLRKVIERQFKLVIQWMSIGFIHGVMNTDNTSIAGETFDYGPCAFMNGYDPRTVFSSIDTQGRYAYGNQPSIIGWNLTRLAETLLPLIHEKQQIAIETVQPLIDDFGSIYEAEYQKVFLKKLGIIEIQDRDELLLNELLGWMEQVKADFTNTFRGLTEQHLHADPIYQDELFLTWKAKWEERTASIADRDEIMNAVNPSVIPRNHLVEEALVQGAEGDMSAFNVLLEKVQNPFELGDFGRYQQGPEDESGYKTFCGT